ncbi:MAG: response regulator transcription factor [Armatimonadota bacterium]|nr:response regulator transcription factor [bacterium]
MRLMVVDDHPVVLTSVCAYMKNQGYEIVATAESAGEALSCILNGNIDVVVMDIMLGDGTAIDVLKQLRKELVPPAVAFSGYDSPEQAMEFMRAGGIGFVSKACKMNTLTEAIESVASGKSFVAPSSLWRKLNDWSAQQGQLSQKEREVVKLITSGLSSKAAADKLCVSTGTIKTHRLRIFRKLGVHTVAELTRYAVEHRLTTGKEFASKFSLRCLL